MTLTASDLDYVVPAYRAKATVRAAVSSVLDQAPEVRVLVVDDGCPDGGYEQCLADLGPRVRVVRPGGNFGVSAARNAGVLASDRAAVAFLDADDQAGPGAVAAVLRGLNAGHDVVVQALQHCRADAEGRFEASSAERVGGLLRPDFGDDALLALLAGSTVSSSQVAVRRSALARSGLFDSSLRHCEDWDLLLRLALAGCRFGVAGSATVYYAVHGGQVSAGAAKMAAGGLYTLRKVMPALPATGPYRSAARAAWQGYRCFGWDHGLRTPGWACWRTAWWDERACVARRWLRGRLHRARRGRTRADERSPERLPMREAAS